MSDQTFPPFTTRVNEQMPQGLSPEAVEGRLIAHRTVLALILAEVQKGGGALALMEQLESLSVMQDHQEDPGAVTSGPEVIEGALAAEIAAVVLAASPERSGAGEAG